MRFDVKSLVDQLKHAGPAGVDGWFDPGAIPFIPPEPNPLGAGPPFEAAAGATQTVLYAPGGGGGAAQPGGAGAGGTTASTPTSSGTSPFVINISWDSSVASAPSAFTQAVIAAAQYLESQITDAVTVNISVGWGEVNGTSLGNNALGESISYLQSVSYASLRGARAAAATSRRDTSAVASLPASSPVSGNFWTTTANAKAVGLLSATNTATDGFVGFSSTLPFDYDTSNGVTAGSYDFNAVALHEMTEVMGRILLTGTRVSIFPNGYNLMDLFHYASAGTRDFSASTPGYLSADGGASSLGTFNTVSGGDAGDWASSMGNDAFDAFSNSGVVNPVTANDINAMDLIGWNLAGTSSPPPSAPTGIAAAALTSGLAAGQASGSSLGAGTALAFIVQTGGSSTDSYSYTLGGNDAGSFALTTSNNTATLAVGATALAASTSAGQMFALTVTPTDTNTSQSGPASPLDVIVGSAGADTIANLTGSIAAATPTFIYALAGNDSIDGSGMSGPLWLDGGAGADTMTGGSGANHYLYAATSDSTASLMDIITNFHAAADLIDLTGLGVTLNVAGKLKSGSIGAHSVGWQTSGGNTFVYVNTSAGSEKLASANMKIELQGSVPLTSGNFLNL
jgi:hypothetical protein